LSFLGDQPSLRVKLRISQFMPRLARPNMHADAKIRHRALPEMEEFRYSAVLCSFQRVELKSRKLFRATVPRGCLKTDLQVSRCRTQPPVMGLKLSRAPGKKDYRISRRKLDNAVPILDHAIQTDVLMWPRGEQANCCCWSVLVNLYRGDAPFSQRYQHLQSTQHANH
jgi:hypothetical protein